MTPKCTPAICTVWPGSISAGVTAVIVGCNYCQRPGSHLLLPGHDFNGTGLSLEGNLHLDQVGFPSLNQRREPTDGHAIDLHGSKCAETPSRRLIRWHPEPPLTDVALSAEGVAANTPALRLAHNVIVLTPVTNTFMNRPLSDKENPYGRHARGMRTLRAGLRKGTTWIPHESKKGITEL